MKKASELSSEATFFPWQTLAFWRPVVRLGFIMVEGAGRGANTASLFDTIHFRSFSKHINRENLSRLYVDEHLSTTQIAAKLGYSRSFIITTLKRMKLLRPKTGSQTNPLNYLRTPPYGYRVVDGRLEISPVEVKVCRLIVHMVDEQGWKFLKVAHELEKRGIKKRDGKAFWHNYTVSRIYQQWKGKV